jgi:hypothetical protein
MPQGLICKLYIRLERRGEQAEDGNLYKHCLGCGKEDDRRDDGTGVRGRRQRGSLFTRTQGVRR